MGLGYIRQCSILAYRLHHPTTPFLPKLPGSTSLSVATFLYRFSSRCARTRYNLLRFVSNLPVRMVMTIYVDAIRQYPSGLWCHMATDGPIEELHRFAERMGLSRSRLQHHRLVPHYDLRPLGRERAIALGAIEVSSKELLRRTRRDWSSLASSSSR